ncbi:MAG: RNA-binding protein [Candidatus Pacearchaeota archaeon]|jgi:RNA recognition motif-containing protein
MSKKLYVGNLPFSVTMEKLKELFSSYGELGEVTVITNKYTGKSKGFGFVTVEDDSEADKAISEMNGKEIEGRALTVNEAKPFDPDKPRPPRRDFGGGRRFGGGDRGGFGGGDRGGFGGGRRFSRRD